MTGLQEKDYMALIDLVVDEIVKIPLESHDKPDVIRELVQILKDAEHIDDFEAALKAVQVREDQQSTGLTDGIAVPHAKSSAVTNLKLAIGISPEGIDFDSVDKQPSKLFFLLLAPPGMSGPHVEALAEIAKLSRSKALCKALVSAQDSHEVVELLRGD
jgi:fructose-specific phosphotransferase system IIA component